MSFGTAGPNLSVTPRIVVWGLTVPRTEADLIAPQGRARNHIWRERIMEMRLELVAVPVTDVDRAKAFYTEQLGFNADHDIQVDDSMRFIQLTPPGSACSIALGTGIIDTEPGSLGGMQMVVASAAEAHAELSGRGVAVSDVQEFPWGKFVFFADPDGNRWALQEIPPRN
jgi:catechol 2,3-dioxygenase-like lactoylglutathione lyase family enzyme